MQLSLLAPLAATSAIVVYWVVSLLLQWRHNVVKAKALGCRRAPALGGDIFGYQNVRDMLKADGEKRMPDFQIERMNELSGNIGRVAHTFELQMPPGKTQWFTAEPKNIQAMLALQFKDFQLPESRIGNFLPLLGRGIFTANAKDWEHSRSLLRPQFVRDQISDLDLEERHVKNMMLAIRPSKDGWTGVTDLQVLFFRLTLDSATEFLFGDSVDSQLDGLPGAKNSATHTGHDENVFAYAFDRGQWYLARGSRFGDLWYLAHGKEFRDLCAKVHNFVDYFVQLAVKHQLKEKGPATDKKEKYIFLEALAEEVRDPVELRSQLLNILLAGRDTTASLLGWTFRLLAEHPDMYERLRSKVLADFGSYDQPKAMTFAGLKNCQLLQWVLNESLRLYPVVPLNSRQAVRDTTLPLGGGPDGKSPIFIPKGRDILYAVHVMHHRRDLWGEDADAFRPDRWAGRRPGWEYLPFNGGPRICIGQQFALTEASYVTVRLLQRFDRIDAEPLAKGPVRHGLTLTNCPADGVKVRLHAAE